MSLCIGVKKNDVVSLFCDSLVSNEVEKMKFSNLNNSKIFKLKGLKNCFVASSGSFADLSIIRTLNMKRKYNDNFLISYDFIVNELIPLILENLEKYGRINFDERPIILDSSFLICQKNKLFVINSDLSVFEIDNNEFYSIGSGSMFAFCLFENCNFDDLNEVKKIFFKVSKRDLYVDLPVVFVNTKINLIKKTI